jgi:hypothetical protein
MAILLNQVSNLRMRLDLLQRLSDGIQSPASLRMVSVPAATLLDLDLIRFLHALEELLAGTALEGQPEARLEASIDPAIGLRIGGGPEAYQVEVGIDLLNVLEPLGGQSGERGSDLSLFRFDSNKRAVAAFCAALIAEFQGFPTDPSLVARGNPG